jgi:hypothetical protein
LRVGVLSSLMGRDRSERDPHDARDLNYPRGCILWSAC